MVGWLEEEHKEDGEGERWLVGNSEEDEDEESKEGDGGRPKRRRRKEWHKLEEEEEEKTYAALFQTMFSSFAMHRAQTCVERGIRRGRYVYKPSLSERE